ncbi:MAG: restriction endonuclease subunit S [Phascolarctobacterium sp.]|nr:restriction endonuclease subunit S [Phascolarctobacterium sp.]
MNVPKLRFKEFTGEWEEKLIGDCFVKINDRNKTKSINNIISNTAKYGLVKQEEYFDKDIAIQENTENYYVIDKGDFVYNPRKSVEAPYGPIRLYQLEETGIVSPLYLCFRSKNKLFDYFYNYFFQSSKWYRYIYRNGDSGARADRVNIKDEVFFSLNTFLPILDEQEKIVDFLNIVCRKINNQQAIVESLEKQKKGLMQKIFSQELRFKDDDGKEFPDWEEKLIKEVCSISTGKSNTQDKVDDGVYPFYVRSSVVEKSDKYLYDEEAVLTVGDGVGTGKIYHYVNGKYDLHQRVYRMYDFVGVSAKYFYFYFSSHFYDRVSKMSAKNSVDSVRLNMIADMRISVPCMGEQTKIVEVLTGVERQLNISKEVLEHWRQIKKGLLQQMFV